MAGPLFTEHPAQARPKEPVLPRRPRHRASGTAERGVLGIGRPRHAVVSRGRAAAPVVLWAICGLLLVAAVIAIIFSASGGSGAGAHSEGAPESSGMTAPGWAAGRPF